MRKWRKAVACREDVLPDCSLTPLFATEATREALVTRAINCKMTENK